MSLLTLTDYANSAIANGVTLNVNTVKFGTGTGYVPTTGMTDLVGSLLWSGPIANTDSINSTTVDFLCVFPEYTSGGTVSVGELALFTDTGMMYAIGCLPYPVVKPIDLRFKIHALCRTSDPTSNLTVTSTWTSSLPRILSYAGLTTPQSTGDNAILVNKGVYDNTGNKPVLVTRYQISETEPMAWAMVNGCLYYKGVVSFGTLENTFTLVANPIFNSEPEQLLFTFAYIYEGPGVGLCRAIKYNPINRNFEFPDTKFVGTVDNTSKLLIWAESIVVVKNMVYKGLHDPTSGVYPTNAQIGDYYIADMDGMISGTHYYFGDWIHYNGTGWERLSGGRNAELFNGNTWQELLDQITNGHVQHALLADLATEADHATNSDNAIHANSSGTATNAEHATTSDTATNATNATNSVNSINCINAEDSTTLAGHPIDDFLLKSGQQTLADRLLNSWISAGTYTGTYPTGVSTILIALVGGGGGAAGGHMNQDYGGAGGGGSSLVLYRLLNVVAGNSFEVTVGTGGAGGAYGSNGENGVPSTFKDITTGTIFTSSYGHGSVSIYEGLAGSSVAGSILLVPSVNGGIGSDSYTEGYLTPLVGHQTVAFQDLYLWLISNPGAGGIINYGSTGGGGGTGFGAGGGGGGASTNGGAGGGAGGINLEMFAQVTAGGLTTDRSGGSGANGCVLMYSI